MLSFRAGVLVLALLVCLAGCQHAPGPDYTETPRVVQKRAELQAKLLELLPENQRAAAKAEATWLADTAYRGAAAIARYNDPLFVNWLNNRTVNTRHHWRHRGLCWHYQHDMYRELRRRPLNYFRLGCCARDIGTGSEHHVVYLTGKHVSWPRVIMLDAWWYTGRLRVDYECDPDEWTDDGEGARRLGRIYPEGHGKPLEHWAMVRRSTRYNDYVYSHTPEARDTPQYVHMQEQMKKGLEERKGKAVDY